MKNIFFICLVFLFISCQTNTPQQDTESRNVSAIPQSLQKDFIKTIKKIMSTKHVTLTKQLLIINNTDTIHLPQPLPNKEATMFTAKQGELAVALRLTLLNPLQVSYHIEMVEFGKASHTQEGIARLSPMFFIGVESDVDPSTGEAYFSDEYTETKGDCITAIRIQNNVDSSEASSKIKLIKNCNGKIRDIDLDNFPTLFKK